MIDPAISLSFAVYSSPGAYAPLIGSGVSRGAGIPTGWEVVLDLIQRVAQLRGEETAGDPVRWYRDAFGTEPSYSALLPELAPEPTERQRLLASYFEPTDDEREQGLKVPTAAHKAVASLARDGLIKVILTTNFDRLLEQALEALGVVPTVIASPDSAEGALPLAHSSCTLIKLHGDYLDARILNTADELSHYDARIDRLLDRVLDEYGLVVCGWSADWDRALAAAIERCSTHRFTTYWTRRGDVGPRAAKLIQLRRAVEIPIADADTFFSDILEKVAALKEMSGASHPLSSQMAVSTVKRLLPDDHNMIRLHDLMHEEVSRVLRETSTDQFPIDGPIDSHEELVDRLGRYEAISATLVAMLAVAGYWGRDPHRALLLEVLDRLANRWENSVGGNVAWINLSRYPAVLALYAVGLGAVAAGNLKLLAHILGDGEARSGGSRGPLIHDLAVVRVVDENLLQTPGAKTRFYTPASDRLGKWLREPLQEIIPSDGRYRETFDRFEYLFALAFADLDTRSTMGPWAPAGSFGWRQNRATDGSLFDSVEEEAKTAGNDWPFLRGSLFSSSLDRFLEVKQPLDAKFRGLPWW